jgi:hypothetical protein
MTDHFEGNRFAAFDAVVLKVLKPADMANRRLNIYRPTPAAVNSPWSQLGSRVTFRIAAEMIAPEVIIFEPAIHDLSVKKNSEAQDREAGND